MATMTHVHTDTFKRGSTTYYNSSAFFPENVRNDVFVLYGFVRVADDFVDSVPQDESGFSAFCSAYRSAMAGVPSGDRIIDSFVDLMRRRDLDESWVDAFLHSMQLDLVKSTYDRMDETLEYIYGSAEVIGLFMAMLLGLPEQSYPYAQLQGRSMQYINFIRDLDEDAHLGRRYLPITGSGLPGLDSAAALQHRDRFKTFVRGQVEIYRMWQREAEHGYRFIPRRFLIPIKTASDMYGWTADRIEADPLIVFQRKVKPRKSRIYLQVLKNALFG